MNFFIERSSTVPIHVQLKEQIKLALAYGALRPGDVLPSIRDLAKDLGIGQAFVKRAYKDLRDLGILKTVERKRITINHLIPHKFNRLMVERCESLCELMLDKVQKIDVHEVAFARLFLKKASERASSLRSYIYVDASPEAAKELADQISRAWHISVVGVSIPELMSFKPTDFRQIRRVLVNYLRYDYVAPPLKRRGIKVIPIRIRYSEKMIERVASLPDGSSVMLVFSESDLKLNEPVIKDFEKRFGTRLKFYGEAINKKKLSELAASRKYDLILVSTHLWNQIPEHTKNIVIRAETQVDLQSLEEARIAAGIIM